VWHRWPRPIWWHLHPPDIPWRMPGRASITPVQIVQHRIRESCYIHFNAPTFDMITAIG
jgi:hypothetical protein